VARYKLPSSVDNYAAAVVAGIAELRPESGLDAGDVASVLHGCTVATNAILELKGRAALLTTHGFRDVLELRRIRVPRLYDPLWRKPPPLVPRQLCFEILERIGPAGSVVVPLAEGDVEQAIAALQALEIEAIAVCFLHTYVNPAHDQEVRRLLRAALLGRFVTLSTEILPEIRDYERASTAVINAYVGPPMQRYIGDLADRLATRALPAGS
jgi:N-methylhydantoinase A